MSRKRLTPLFLLVVVLALAVAPAMADNGVKVTYQIEGTRKTALSSSEKTIVAPQDLYGACKNRLRRTEAPNRNLCTKIDRWQGGPGFNQLGARAASRN